MDETQLYNSVDLEAIIQIGHCYGYISIGFTVNKLFVINEIRKIFCKVIPLLHELATCVCFAY